FDGLAQVCLQMNDIESVGRDPRASLQRNGIHFSMIGPNSDPRSKLFFLLETHLPRGMPIPAPQAFAGKIEVRGEFRMKDVYPDGYQSPGRERSRKCFERFSSVAAFIQKVASWRQMLYQNQV